MTDNKGFFTTNNMGDPTGRFYISKDVPDIDLKNIDLNEVTTSGHYNFDTDMTVHSIKMPELKRGDLLTIETEKGIETVKVVNEYRKGNDLIIETTSLNGKEDK